jgi:hypothetical protein
MAMKIGGAMVEFGSGVVQGWSWLLRKVVLEMILLGSDGKTGVDEEGPTGFGCDFLM